MPKPAQVIPETLRPFCFHGLQLDWSDGREATCDCPSCGRGERKFGVSIETGEYKCFGGGCDFGEGGGSVKFIRWLWGESDRQTTNAEIDAMAADRRLQYPETLSQWGACVSTLSGAWLLPGYNPDGALVQLYKRIRMPDRWELRPTPGMGGHAVHGLPLFSGRCDTVYLCEGPWDAMALWEQLRTAKAVDGRLEFTGNVEASLLGPADSSVLAVPNCGAVGEPLKRFLPLLTGRRVVLCFDSDHPTQNEGRAMDGAGYAATKRAAAMLADVSRETCWLRWGEPGYDAGRPSGYDLRDLVTQETA